MPEWLQALLWVVLTLIDLTLLATSLALAYAVSRLVSDSEARHGRARHKSPQPYRAPARIGVDAPEDYSTTRVVHR